ncbi:hypothetical protein BWZ22_07550 [Seonamhaeicola sp. S2-3]|uniref:DUF805 domain-containing protein n=1 Tax=Seonamhaeicola sp. S2-3 TaxID=1936081 RepID=UPI000972BCF6|nr:DUF805 domain-containing protein [Seonamhaeicola sp. S2-3]APY11105.1 hypothetical protein BWZ22_07550 [Seonamhaeicola sp. S2-3]
MTHTNFEIKPLSSQDRSKLRKQYLFAVLFLLVASAIFSFIYFFVIKPDNFSGIPIVIFSIFLLFFAGIISYLFWNTYIDLKRGIKHCYTGVVTDKRIDKHTTNSRNYNTRIGTNTRHKSSRTYYYITIDNKEHSVPFSKYTKVNVNDKVYLESSPKNKEVLTFTVLEKNQNPVTPTVNTSYSTLFKSKSITKPMSQSEIDLVKKSFFKKVRRALIYITIYSILLFMLWLGIFLFLIPVIIAFTYTSIKLLILINNYAKFNRNGRLKNITTVQVTDKLTMTSNTNSTKFRVTTNVENIDVSQKIYNKLKTNDIIELHKATFLKNLVGVSINEGTQYLENL